VSGNPWRSYALHMGIKNKKILIFFIVLKKTYVDKWGLFILRTSQVQKHRQHKKKKEKKKADKIISMIEALHLTSFMINFFLKKKADLLKHYRVKHI